MQLYGQLLQNAPTKLHLKARAQLNAHDNLSMSPEKGPLETPNNVVQPCRLVGPARKCR